MIYRNRNTSLTRSQREFLESRTVYEAGDPQIDRAREQLRVRMQRLTNSWEALQFAWNKYSKNPDKYKPQLKDVNMQARTVGRLAGMVSQLADQIEKA